MVKASRNRPQALHDPRAGAETLVSEGFSRYSVDRDLATWKAADGDRSAVAASRYVVKTTGDSLVIRTDW